jgi:predicted metalloprotease with PDZ domain
MKTLYTDFARHRKGYTMENIQYLAEQLINEPLDSFFSDYVTGTRDTKHLLDQYLSDFGLKIIEKKNVNPIEQSFGVRMMEKNGIWKVVKIMPGSPSEKALHLNDEIIQINGRSFDNEQLTEDKMNQAKFKVLRQGMVKTLQLSSHGKSYLPTCEIQINVDSDKDAARRGWLSAHG